MKYEDTVRRGSVVLCLNCDANDFCDCRDNGNYQNRRQMENEVLI